MPGLRLLAPMFIAYAALTGGAHAQDATAVAKVLQRFCRKPVPSSLPHL